MHITCRRRDLYRALRLLSRFIPTHSTLPILQNVLIEAPGIDRLRLVATNLQVGVACLIEAAVEQEGSAAISALPLLAFLRGSSGEERATLRTGNAPPLEDRARTFLLVDDLVALPCMDATEFPRVRGPAEAALTIRCLARLLREVVAQVAFAASPTARDTILSNVWLQVDGKIAAFAASNGSRCALRTVSGAGSQAREELLLIPARALAAIARLLPGRVRCWWKLRPTKACSASARTPVSFLCGSPIPTSDYLRRKILSRSIPGTGSAARSSNTCQGARRPSSCSPKRTCKLRSRKKRGRSPALCSEREKGRAWCSRSTARKR